MTFLQLRGVGKTVSRVDDRPLVILSGVDLVVEVGDRLSIVGRSGSGKSTLLNLLGLLDSPTEGDILLDDVPTRRFSARQRDVTRGRDVGFIFQQFNLLQGRTALENVMTPLLYDTGSAFWRRRTIASEMLERVGLGHRLESTPDRLSGGEQQRVAIARALVRRPRLILADEPTGALDIETGEIVMALLDEIATASSAALVTITHDPAIAALASRRFQLERGGLVEASADPASVAVAAASAAVSASTPVAVPASVPVALPKPAPAPASVPVAVPASVPTPAPAPAAAPVVKS